MNHVFRIIWSKTLRAWIVASELATRCSKSGRDIDKRVSVASAMGDCGDDSASKQPWPLRLGILMALLLANVPAQAVDRWWDPNGTGIGQGGTATWDTTNSFWSPNSDGVSGPYSAWSNAALFDAFFGGTAGTVTLSAPIAVHNMTFQTGGYTVAGSTLSLGGTTPTVSVTTGTTTINSILAGSAGLTKAGGGTLALNGSNTFSGGINVLAGVLSVNGDAALGNASNGLTLANGTHLVASGALSANRVATINGSVVLSGNGVGTIRITGAGNVNARAGVTLSNDASDYTGTTNFSTPAFGGDYSFTSIADTGMASSVGAGSSISASSSGGVGTVVHYLGTGHSSNRNWQIFVAGGPAPVSLRNDGTGTLTLTGNMVLNGTGVGTANFVANSADLSLLGVISGTTVPSVAYSGGAGRTITLGGANTYTSSTSISGVTVRAGVLANAGVSSSIGAATGIASAVNVSGNGVLSYTGTGTSTNRDWTINNGTVANDGSGALTLSGALSITNTATLGGSYAAADNLHSGVISGTGGLAKTGAGTWEITGVNTYTGATTVNNGILRAGNAQAFGTGAAVVNGGTLDLNGFDFTRTTLSGTGGAVALGSGTLTLEAAAGTTASYGGSITGSGGLTKLGGSSQTLTGSNTYAGDTTIGGGTLNLNFSGAGGPTSNIISSASTLNMSGGALSVTGAAGEANTQTFDGLNVTAGNSNIAAISGASGSMTVNLGAITRTGGLIDFDLPGSGNITTTNTTLGGWATVNGTDYAKVVGGNILAFEEADYTDKDNAANWLDNEFITDVAGFFGTVTGSKQLGGLRYTRPVSTTVTVQPGQTLGVDGTIIVAPTVGGFNQTITGGFLTGAAGGGSVGIQQNSTSNFTIASQIVDNGGSIGFTKAGTGLVTLTNANNSYTGATTIAQGTLSVDNIGNGGVASGIGASSADASNLVLEGSTLRYTGGSTTSDRGFTLARSGAITGGTVEVSNSGANLTFGGQVTSSDGAGLTKTGAGTLTLANGTNDFTGIVTVTGGLLSVDTLANGGVVSGIGASSANSANLVLNGGGLQYTGATTTTDRGFTLGVNRGTIDVADAGTTLTISGTAAGSGTTRLTKEGAGTLVLSGTNTYVGGNTVNAGVLRAGSTQAFGTPNTANVMTLANAAGVTLDLNGFDNVIGPLNGGGINGGNVTLGSATLRIAGGDGNYSGVISGTGGVLRTNGGIQTFNGCNNTYTGATTLQGATLSVNCLANGGAASGIGASSSASTNLTFTNGNLNYTGGTVSIDRGFNLAGYGVIDVVNGTTLGFSGQVIGGGELYKDNAGTLVLSGNNTYTNNTQVRGGTLRAGSSTAFGTTNAFVMANTAGALLDLNNFNANAGALVGGGAAGGNIALGTGTLTIRDGLSQTYAGAISGTGNLIKNGAGIQTLSGCNSSYSGTTTINAGVLAVSCLENGGVNSSIGASAAGPANLVLNGGTLRYVGTGDSTDRQFTLGTNGGALDASGTGTIDFAYNGPVTLAGANTARTLTLTGTNTGDNVFSAQLDNNGTGATSLTKTGTGTWRLTNNNSTYTGVTRINGGVLSVDQLANGGLASSIGASSNAAANLVIGNGSTLRYTGAGDTTDRQFTLDTGVTFIESSGTGALQFTNTGPVTLSGTNTARTIALGGTNTGNNTLGGTIGNNGTGATTLAKNDSGTWILTGNNSYTGNTVINDGNLVIGNGGTTGNAGAGNVIVDSPTSTLSLNRSDTFTFNGTLSGPGTLAQIGTGTSVLTSAGNSIGATTISAGTLQVNGGLATSTVGMTGTSALTVNGTVQAPGNTQTALTGDAGEQTITVSNGGTLLANGDLGDGGDSVDIGGTLNTGNAALNLGSGNDMLMLHDASTILGSGVQGGAGSGDSLVVDNASAYTLDATLVGGFEALTKQNGGVLTTTGNHSFAAGVTVQDGTLDVDGSIDTAAVSLADDTTLNVDGAVNSGGAPVNLTGSAGSNTVQVNAGGSLSANGNLGDGADVLRLAGALDTGVGVLGLGIGDDVAVLTDGATVTGAGLDAGAGLNDQLVLDNTLALTFNGSQTAGFEDLLKQGPGTAIMTGSQSFIGGTTIAGGVLDIDGALETPTIALADGTALNVDGSVQAAGGTATAIIGTAGDNTVSVGATGTLLATGDLGAGADTLDVAGTLDIGGAVFALGDGDDNFVVHDGTVVLGTVDGGAGQDTRTYDINTSADLGALANFEGVTKTGTGVLNINGLGATDLQEVQVFEGTLNIGPAGSVVATAGSSLDTVVASGATLNVDGSYGCGASSDTMDVSGTVSGTGTIDLCGGDDTLTLRDGAILNNTISGGTGSGDTLVLDTVGTWSFDAGNTADFELLQKDNTGTATLVGIQGFIGGTTITGGVLDVDGTLETPTIALADGTTLNVDGIAQASGSTATTITGTTGVNTVTVGSGGTLLATGDLGAGEDMLDVVGTLDTMGGGFALGDGDDAFLVHDGTVVLGTVDGGAGLDTRVYDINLAADLGALVNFEGVTKTGAGVLNINGPGTTDLQEVSVLGGTLNIGPGGGVTAIAGGPLDTVVASGATLRVDGSYGCGASDDTLTVAGTVSGTGTIDLCGGEDVLTLQDGAVLANVVSGGSHGSGDTIVLDTADAFTFDAANTINFEYLQKDNAGEATLVGTQSFTGGTTVNGGVLTVTGQLETPTVAMADDTVLNVDGTLDAAGGTAVAITGSAGVNTVTVGGTLLATGDLGDGNDVLDVAGTLDTAGGAFVLGNGDDTLTIHDGTNIIGTVVAGAGNDTFNADIALGADLGAVQDFETLSKTNVGVLNINGPMSSDFTAVHVLGGTLNVTAGGSVSAQSTTVAAGGTLQIDGGYTGTEGNDTFTSRGTVIGALAFGDGNDAVDFIGGNVSGVTNLDGGAGSDDRLNFHGLSLDNDVLTPATGWERVDLLEGSELALNAPLNLSGGLLSIDATSQLIASAGASLTGNLANSGLISVGSSRFGVNGNYTGGGALALTVSPAALTSGGLDISGDVVGTTAIAFDSDGTQAPPQSASILVISSPNDDPATAGGFTPADSADGTVRLNGSVFPWSFGQQADGWYLNAETDVVLPEIGGYALLPSIGQAGILENDRLLSQRLSGIRGDQPRCDQNEDDTRAYWKLVGDCHGFWMAATASELEMGADPGFEFSGDSVGVYVGADVLLQDRETRTFRGGLYAGFQRGNYWATGANSTGLQSIGQANVRTDTPTFGMYGSVNWREGSYLDTTLVAQIPEATIAVAGGFKEEILGNSLTLSTQVGRRFHLDNGWTLEPQAQLSASAVHWRNKTDASGKQLAIDDGLLGKARVAVRAEKVFETDGGARIRPWATLGMQDTIGESENALVVASPGLGADAAAFPNHELGRTATLDLGVEAELNESVSLFGVLSYDKSIEGTDAEQRQANLGVRIRW